MSSDLIADVALRATIGPGESPVFSYRVPPRLHGLVFPGQLVWAPLRRRRVQGVVLGLSPGGERDVDLRELADLADPEASVPPAGMRLATWVAATYRAPLYEAIALLLPPGVGQEAATTWRVTSAGLLADLGALPERERAILYYLRLHGEQAEGALRAALRGGDAELRAAYAALHERGMLARGATLSAPRVRPRRERLVRLDLPRDELDAALAELDRAPKQAAVVRWLASREQGNRGTGEQGNRGTGEQGNRGTGEQGNRGTGEQGNRGTGEQGNRGTGEQPGSRAAGQPGSRRAGQPDSRAAGPGDWHEGDEPAEGERVAYPVAEVYAATGASAQLLRELERRGLIAFAQREVRRDPLAGDGVPPDSPPQLTPGQRDAYEQIASALEARSAQPGGASRSSGSAPPSGLQPAGFAQPGGRSPASGSSPAIFLLHGITGSGKTEVYLRAIARAMRLGRQALVLVPEIALTTQLVRRFAARFPGRLAVLHSGLGLGERYDEWRRLRRGEARLAIGSRSAVFAPLPELGLIIVDEEHELTYKHDSSPRYHARDAALHLAELTGCVVVLGSATPSVESYQAAQTGRYRLLEMPERVGGGLGPDGLPQSKPLPLPPVRLVDMRRELQSGNRSIFSRPLQQAIDATLERREQVILFLNRRGAAAFVMCRDCGHVVGCPACSGPLTVHYDELDEGQTPKEARPSAASSVLICHSCGYSALIPAFCSNCLSPRVKSFGVGTQRVVEEVAALFPHARALRWDRDSVSGKGAHSRMLDTFLRHDADVLVGTQMIAKGLDLPLVSLVGVVAADTGLQLPDFRSGERAFQLLTQVAGRAGRRSSGAQVIIQTYNPDHYALRAAQEHDFKGFYQQEIAYRRATGYPPYGRLVRFVCGAGSEAAGRREAEKLAERAQALIERRRLEGWGLVGPAPAFIQRVRGRWRWHLIVRIPAPQADPRSIDAFLDALGPLHGWVVDVDPAHVL